MNACLVAVIFHEIWRTVLIRNPIALPFSRCVCVCMGVCVVQTPCPPLWIRACIVLLVPLVGIGSVVVASPDQIHHVRLFLVLLLWSFVLV